MPRVHIDTLALVSLSTKETILADKWQPIRPGQMMPLVRSVAAMVAGGIMPAVFGPEVVRPDKWTGERPDLMVQVDSYVPSGGIMPDFTGHEVVFADKWLGDHPDLMPAVEAFTPSGGVVPDYTGPEITFVSEWRGYQPDSFRHVATPAKLPSGGIIPAFTGHEVIYLDKFAGSRPDLFPQVHAFIPSISVGSPLPIAAGGAPTTSVDRWQGSIPQLRPALRLETGGMFQPVEAGLPVVFLPWPAQVQPPPAIAPAQPQSIVGPIPAVPYVLPAPIQFQQAQAVQVQSIQPAAIAGPVLNVPQVSGWEGVMWQPVQAAVAPVALMPSYGSGIDASILIPSVPAGGLLIFYYLERD